MYSRPASLPLFSSAPRRLRLPLFYLVLALLSAHVPGRAQAQDANAGLQEPWDAGYMGQDARGPHVLGYWKFEAGAELKDSSGKGHDLVENGARLGAKGAYGKGVESFEGYPVSDKPHSLRVTHAAGLTPAEGLSLEMWIQPKPGFAKTGRCYLLDKRYVPDNHTDYAWQLMEPDKSGQRRMLITLGFGSRSETFFSEPLALPDVVWQHLAVTYDSAGTVCFYIRGSLITKVTRPGLGALVPGTRELHLGDRIGSNYGGFPGFFDEVRICRGARLFEPLKLEVHSPRLVWRRMEKAAPIVLTCQNLRYETVTGAVLKVEAFGETLTWNLPDLSPGAAHRVQLPVNTALKPGPYPLHARLAWQETLLESRTELQIAPRPVPAMPVIMWGGGAEAMPQMKDIGFTHFIGLRASNLEALWQSRLDNNVTPPPGTAEEVEQQTRMLDAALAQNMGVIASLSPGHWLEGKKELLRVDRAGKPLERPALCAGMPELPLFFEKLGRSVSAAYGRHPAYAATLINTEVRDASRPSFNAVDVEAYRAFAGADIPPEVVQRTGVEWARLKDFPASRVIPAEHPILKYYRWFWTVGDGWNGLHTALSKGIRSHAGREHWTFFDPAVRQPSISGAGGAADVLSHWTYTYPDPQRIGLCTDQLLAMSEATARRQRVMKMTQLIWYRSQTAPVKPGQPGETVAWEDHDPDAAYITIAPMHLKEALWTKLSRPVEGIMYHGWQSLVPTEGASSYRYTHPDTVHVLKELLHSVVRPLGPTLMALQDNRAEVAFLESFTAQMFARRGGYGNNMGWSADVWMALQHAHVPTDVLYEETLLKNGLSGRKVLVMTDCDVLSEPVVQRIQDWQKRGGKIIGDENLCPALKADVTLTSYRREKKAAADKARLLELAATLKPQVAALGVLPGVQADTPEVILRSRRFGDARYVFAINDRREAGTYVGQHGLVLENGVPTTATLTLPVDVTSASIYDLRTGSLVLPTRNEAGHLQWKAELGPCDGTVFMILPKPLLQLGVQAPAEAKAGQSLNLQISLTSTQEAPLKAAIPMQVELRDAGGRAAEGSGWYVAENGILTLPVDLATNETPGVWEIRIRDLASGMTKTAFMRVSR